MSEKLKKCIACAKKFAKNKTNRLRILKKIRKGEQNYWICDEHGTIIEKELLSICEKIRNSD